MKIRVPDVVSLIFIKMISEQEVISVEIVIILKDHKKNSEQIRVHGTIQLVENSTSCNQELGIFVVISQAVVSVASNFFFSLIYFQ